MTKISIDGIPSFIWGEKSDKVFIAVHGKKSSKEDFTDFASIAVSKGYQVLSFDLPEHGERKNQGYKCNPWNSANDLRKIMGFARHRWLGISLYAVSIGAYFSMLACKEEKLKKCLFLSPVLDMAHLIENMMKWSGVDAATLKAKEEIPTSFGEALSWEYYNYVKQHNIENWNIPTEILYGSKDNLTDGETVKKFITRFNCGLTVMQGGEHWFHTDEQLDFLRKWLEQNI